jgi:hypothetical protein
MRFSKHFGRACQVAVAYQLLVGTSAMSQAPRQQTAPSANSPKAAATGHTMTTELDASQGLCVSYTYDANGNRITQTSGALNAVTPTWGAVTYPCFIWGG